MSAEDSVVGMKLQRELAVSQWLRRHGKAVRPHLCKEQKTTLQDCFELIDSDGSGKLDVIELQQVFEVRSAPHESWPR